MPTRQNITLVEIAKKAGVSRQLVSAILNPKEGQNIRFSEESKNKVHEIADKFNYRKNRNFQNMLQKRHEMIGILGKSLHNIYSRELRRYIFEASRNEYLLTFEEYPKPVEYPLFIRESVVDGFIMFEDMGEKINNKIKEIGIPTVHVNSYIEGPGSVINFDDYGSMFIAAEEFISVHRKRPAFIFNNEDSVWNQERIRGFKDACKNYNLGEPKFFDIGKELNHYDQHVSNKCYERMMSFMSENQNIDCIVMEHSAYAFRFYEVCEKLNIKIKDDISVIAIHDEDMGEKIAVKPLLTTLGHEKSISEITVNELIKLINGSKPEEIILKYKLIKRKSI